MTKKEGTSIFNSYFERIGLLLFFVGCAFVSIIVWVCNWICWCHKCCCCDFLHNILNKRLIWWTCLLLLSGILACCISAFVSVNRFGFALEGALCAINRLYYDIINGQLKEAKPKWEGFDNITKIIDEFIKFDSNVMNNITLYKQFENGCTMINSEQTNIYQAQGIFQDNFVNSMKSLENKDIKKINEYNEYILPYSTRYEKMYSSLYQLSKINYIKDLNDFKNFFKKENMDKMKTELVDEFAYYGKIGKTFFKVLSMIYYCLLCIAVTLAALSLILYTCIKSQRYLVTLMHILWNTMRFFFFSFFLYGTAYGILYVVLLDVNAYIAFLFEPQSNLKSDHPYLLPDGWGKQLLTFCLGKDNTNFKTKLNDILVTSLYDFFTNYKESKNLAIKKEAENFVNIMKSNTQAVFEKLCPDGCSDLPERAIDKDGIFGSFDCGFVKYDLHHLYRTIKDASVESRILCAVSLCLAFFGVLAVYLYLLIIHHYNNELFFDRGNNIFTGFFGFKSRNTTREKIMDPMDKKRKLKSELESSSVTNENSNIKTNSKK